MSINGTATPSENRDFNKIKKYMNGFVRDIHFTNHASDKDPNKASMNKIIYIFEGYYENGVLSKSPKEKYGRLFLTDSSCTIGYFTYDSRPREFLLNGKGMVIDGKSNKIIMEGLFDMSRKAVRRKETIEDFLQNAIAID